MTEQNKARPFVAGDIVISPELSVGYIFEMDRKLYAHFPKLKKMQLESGLCADMSDGDVELFDNEYILLDDNNDLIYLNYTIKTIRTPRKGGKEARDIVAMFAKLYRQKLTDILDTYKYLEMPINEYWKTRKAKGYYPFALEKAKRMLGGSDDN